jgi:hypothetical protein
LVQVAEMDADHLFDRTLIPIALAGAAIGTIVGFYAGFSVLGILAGFIFAAVGAFIGIYCGMFIAGKLRSWT